MSLILAFDQGTTSSRSIVFDLSGAPLASAAQEFTQHYPSPGLVEHNPDEIWESQLATAKEALRRADRQASDLAAIGITNQRETTLLWSRDTGKPIGRAIVWQDRRTADHCNRLKEQGLEATVRERTGLVIDPYFSATKIAWMLNNIDGARKEAEAGNLAFGTVDSWLIYKLTGGERHVTDVTNASRTMLFNLHTLDWDDELLRELDIPRTLMPEVAPSAGNLGTTEPGLFGTAIPISGVAGDQQAALFGQACFQVGMAKNTYGTGSFVVMNTGDRPVIADGVLTTLGWQLQGARPTYALEASIFITGAAIQWLRDSLGLIQTSAEVEDLAASVADNGGVYFVPALTGLGSPHWDPYARGLIIGLTRGSTRAHLARAALEAMAFQTCDGIRAMEAPSETPLQELRVDGGACVNNLLMQFQADLLGRPVLRPRVTETTALGAAYLAAVGQGLASTEDLARTWALDRRFEPTMSAARREALHRDWTRAVKRAGRWQTPS